MPLVCVRFKLTALIGENKGISDFIYTGRVQSTWVGRPSRTCVWETLTCTPAAKYMLLNVVVLKLCVLCSQHKM